MLYFYGRCCEFYHSVYGDFAIEDIGRERGGLRRVIMVLLRSFGG